MERKRVVGYVLKGFGRSSETFITSEMALLEDGGLELRVFSLKRLSDQLRHGVIGRVQADVDYLPETTPFISSGSGIGENDGGNAQLIAWFRENWLSFADAHRKLFRRRPQAWLGALAYAIILSLRCPTGPLKESLRSYLKEFFQAGWIAAAVLEDDRIGHLHAHFCHTATTVTMLAARMCGTTFSFTAHAKDIYRVDMNPRDLLRRKLQAAAFAVTCTGANERHLLRLGAVPARLHRIYHGIDLSLFAPAHDRQTHKLPLILSVGRFVEKKGFLDLVEACRILRDEGLEFRAMIVGGATPYADQVSARISLHGLADRVTIHAPLTQEALKERYEEAALFVLPCLITDDGDRDGIPNVMVEAMAMGLPVISTSISGIPELVRDGDTGLLVEQKSPVALAAAIRRLIEAPGFARELSQNGSRFVHHEFDSSRNIAKLRALFDEALSGRKE